MSSAQTNLSARHIIAILGVAFIFGTPAILMVEYRIGPARWLIDVQDRFLGGHLVVSSMLLVILLELLCVGAVFMVVAVVVRVVTGSTLLALLARRGHLRSTPPN